MISRRAAWRRRSIRAGMLLAPKPMAAAAAKPMAALAARPTSLLAAVLLGCAPMLVAASAPRAQPLNARSVTIAVLDVTPPSPPSTTSPALLTVTLQLTNNTDQTLPSVRIDGARGDPIGSRTALDAAIAHPQPPDPNQAATYRAEHPVSTTLDPRASTEVTFTALTSTDNSSVTATNDPKAPGLCICQNQIYPLYFTAHASDISGNDVLVGSGQTFVPAFGGSTPPRPVTVSWVWPLIDQPHRIVGDTTFTDDDLAYSIAGGRLDRVLQVIEQVAAYPRAIAMTLVVDPELIDELAVMATGPYTVTTHGKSVHGTGADAAKSWLARLRAALAADPALELDLTPLADPDVESLTRNGLTWTDGLSPLTQARITAALGSTTAGTSLAWPVDGELSGDTLDTLVRGGATSVIVSDRVLPSTAGIATTNQLATVQTRSGQVNADVTQQSIQRYIAPAISVGGNGVAPTNLPQLVSEVAVDAVASPSASGFAVLVPPRQVNPFVPSAVRAIIETAATAWSTSLTLSAAAHQVAPSNHGQLIAPRTAGGLSSQTILAARTVSSTDPALATMLTDADASRLLGSLPTAVQRAESSAWRTLPEQGDSFARVLSHSIDALQSGVRIVRPSTGRYTLATVNSPLPVTIENTLDVTVTVRVQVQSVNGQPGFTAGAVEHETIAANTKVTLHVPTHVVRTGRFQVQAELLTPSGFPIGQPVQVTVHSTALGAIGVIITVSAAVVLVAALLVRLVRRIRRRSPRAPAALEPVALP